jgi:excisionase family DNA binding protein
MAKENPSSSGVTAQTYSVDDMSEMLGLPVSAIYREAGRGAIPHVKLGKRYIFPRAAIDHWLATAGKTQTAA